MPAYDEVVKEALAVSTQSVSTHSPGSDAGLGTIGVSFNAGKDNMVMLHLIFRALGPERARQLVYFVFLHTPPSSSSSSTESTATDEEFPELVAFRKEQCAAFGITLVEIPSPQREGLWDLYRTRGVRGAFMGVRDTDPSGKWVKAPVTKCSDGWPPMDLYCPLLRWGVKDIWRYTHEHSVPVCPLYANGYTSLGSRRNTVPNPALWDPRMERYRPAWELSDPSLERDCRSMAAPPPPPPVADGKGGASPAPPTPAP